jgi:hypothetical protein
VKTQPQVEARLKKLRSRYAHKHMESTQQRCYKNCMFNEEHTPAQLDYKPLETEEELAPRMQKTLVVIGMDRSVHLCMYGSDKSGTWQGDTCDSDDKAKRCPLFKPRVTIEQAREGFLSSLEDDEYVFDNFRDVATLQWVLGERVHEVPLTLVERFWFWLKTKLWRPIPALPQLPAPELTASLWYDQKDDSPPPS